MQPTIVEEHVYEGSDNLNLARIEDHAGANVQRAVITSWDLTVQDEETGSLVYSLLAQTNADTATWFWYDTLQTTGEWGGKDRKGFNMRHAIVNATIGNGTLKGGRSYLFEYKFTTSSIGVIVVKFRWVVQSTAITT